MDKNERILKSLIRHGEVIRGGKDNYRFKIKSAQLFPGYSYFSKEDFLNCPLEKRITELFGEDAYCTILGCAHLLVGCSFNFELKEAV